MELDNFNNAKIDSYFEQVLDYVCKLCKKNTSDVTFNLSMLKETADNQEQDDRHGSSVLDKKNNENLVDDHMMSLYQQMKDNDQINNQEKVNECTVMGSELLNRSQNTFEPPES
jgi:hypothetical protein